jgi:hypothetical protein
MSGGTVDRVLEGFGRCWAGGERKQTEWKE